MRGIPEPVCFRPRSNGPDPRIRTTCQFVFVRRRWGAIDEDHILIKRSQSSGRTDGRYCDSVTPRRQVLWFDLARESGEKWWKVVREIGIGSRTLWRGTVTLQLVHHSVHDGNRLFQYQNHHTRWGRDVILILIIHILV
jgi:hypothetical protein